jgi:hypothetical protein
MLPMLGEEEDEKPCHYVLAARDVSRMARTGPSSLATAYHMKDVLMANWAQTIRYHHHHRH